MEAIRKYFSKIFSSIRNGMVYTMPLFILGSIGLIIQYFPINAYTNFISKMWNGNFYRWLGYINTMTFGVISIVLAGTISYSRERQFNKKNQTHSDISYVIVGILAFICLSDLKTDKFTFNSLNVQGVFIAMLAAILATSLYNLLLRVNHKHIMKKTPLGIDNSFNRIINQLLPFILTIVIFSVFRIILYVCGVKSIHDSLSSMFAYMLKNVNNNFFQGLLYVLFVMVLWFFGIHGGDVLEASVEKSNILSIDNGIFNKTFNDVFVIMGGCGTALALTLAVIIFSRNKRMRKIGYYGVPFSIFNISEISIFGIPVVFNPILGIPFILCPIVCYIISYSAIALHIVPKVCTNVTWTCPILFSGYKATDSIKGILLQVICLAVSVGIYSIFVKIHDKNIIKKYIADVDKINKYFDNCVATLTEPNIVYHEDLHNARNLAVDIYEAMINNKIDLLYQPQSLNNGKCYGAEALLHYVHPILGKIQTPLVIELAKEAGFLLELEKYIMFNVIKYRSGYQVGIISVNSTANTFEDESFIDYIIKTCESYHLDSSTISIEITEEGLIKSQDKIKNNLNKLKDAGFSVILDDFGMGHTSLIYLQNFKFDTVKIAGELIKDALTNSYSKDIISTIVELGKKMGFRTTAEYVENNEINDLLVNLGIDNFQGYKYSKALKPGEYAIYYVENKTLDDSLDI